MRAKLIVLALVVIPVATFNVAANESEKLQQAVDVMNDLRNAESQLLMTFVSNMNSFSQLTTKTPDVAGYTDTAAELSTQFEEYAEAANKVSKFLKANKASLQGWDEYSDLEDEVSDENLAKFRNVTEANAAFSESLRSELFTVYAKDNTWANTGVTVNEGDLIIIEAEGDWTVSEKNWPLTSWRGYSGDNGGTYRVSPDAPLGALIHRVRGSSNRVGSGFNEFGVATADARGRLEMRINDDDPRNNAGQIDMTVHVFDGAALTSFVQSLQVLSEEVNK